VSATVDSARLDALMEQFVADIGAAMSAPLVTLGDHLGLFRAMAGGEPVTSAALARETGTRERPVREWLAAMAASGYVTAEHDGTFRLTPEQSLVFAQEDSPAFAAGAYEIVGAVQHDEPELERVFRGERTLGWHEHDPALFRGTERFFRPGYMAHLVTEWIPALDGMEARLRDGATVADIGCGHGSSTILMAQAYPRSTFVGSDYHQPSIERARNAAREAGVDDRVTFEVATAQDYSGHDYDMACMFDCLHDMGDPVGAARHVRETLADDGLWMLVEPMAGDTLEDNMNPVGRVFYSASTSICTPASLSQDVGLGLGAQAGEARLREVLEEAGWHDVHRAAETPFNLVLSAAPA
jgi:SAM-dependent methyltransferase